MITLIASDDPDNTRYLVHEEYACFYSPVLKIRFSGDVPTGEMQTFVLDGCHQNVLRLLVQWIYRQEVCSTSSDDYYRDLMELWILADKLGIPRLQNHVSRTTSLTSSRQCPKLYPDSVWPKILRLPILQRWTDLCFGNL